MSAFPKQLLLFALCLILAFIANGNPASSEWPARTAPTKAMLRSLKEPDLRKEGPKGSTDIRFIWLPSFHMPFSIRATGNENRAILRVVRFKRIDGRAWRKIDVEKTFPLSKQQWQELLKLAEVDGAREPSLKADKEIRENFTEIMSGMDGSTWFLEMRDAKGYTVEGVPNPPVEDPEAERKLREDLKLNLRPFMDICMKLLSLSGLDEKPTY